MQRRWLLLAVILTVPSGCDNVTWGGSDVHLQGPSATTDSTAVAEEAAPEPEAQLPALPTGPILLAGGRDGDTATLVAVGEVRGDSVVELPREAEAPGFMAHFARTLFPAGRELVLFSDGARVGRLTVTGTDTDDRFCPARVAVTGVVELVPAASAARRLLALSDTAAARRPFTPYRAYDHDYDMRVASLNLMGAAIPQVGARWPSSILETRADIHAFRLPEDDSTFFAATFLYKDRLSVTPPEDGAYALFFLGVPSRGTYRAAYTAYRPAADDGKGAPRYFDHLDLNGDGRSEILLDVFGARQRWFAELARRGAGWRQVFQDPCGSPTG